MSKYLASVLCTVYEGNKIVRIPFNKLPCFENSSHKSLSSPSNSPAESPSSAGSVSPTTAIIPTSYYRWYFLRYRHFWSVIVIFDPWTLDPFFSKNQNIDPEHKIPKNQWEKLNRFHYCQILLSDRFWTDLNICLGVFLGQITSKNLFLCSWEITKKSFRWKWLRIFHFWP